MTEKILRGHHVKQLVWALNLSWLMPKNRLKFNYIIDGNQEDLVKIVVGIPDDICQSCKNWETKCKRGEQVIEDYVRRYDTEWAKISGVEVGQTYRAKDLISKLTGRTKAISHLLKGLYHSFTNSRIQMTRIEGIIYNSNWK